MGKAILLEHKEFPGGESFSYYVDPPLANGYPNDSVVVNSKKSKLIEIYFRSMKKLGMVMEVWLVDELGKTKDRLSFEYYYNKMKDFDPEKKNPEPFLKALDYNIV